MGRRSAKAAALVLAAKDPTPTTPLRIDLGAGTTKREGFLAVDIKPFPGVDVVCDLGSQPWPWPSNSVDEVFCSHVLEHLTPEQRRHFMNELHRVLKPAPAGKVEPKATLVTPHWASTRAYGDPTHVWPPVCEMTYAYYNAAWRTVNSPHLDGYSMDFEVLQPTYTLHPSLMTRSMEHQQERLGWAKEAAQDMIQVLIKREKAP